MRVIVKHIVVAVFFVEKYRLLFNSLTFLIFAAVFFAAWPVIRKNRQGRWLFLTLASFFFYGWWDWRFLSLIIFSGFIDYFAGMAMGKYPRWKKWFLVASLIGNIGSLAVFKYANFATRNLSSLLGLVGIEASIPISHLILPVGISFYTFQSMSYTIDIYRNKLKATRNVFHFFAYLSMFPQLVAGPIVRATHMLKQLETYKPITSSERRDGLRLIVLGFFKKMVVADTIAPFVNQAFSNGEPIESSLYWWAIMLLFTYQIYCDFSGYSDIARGLGRWMGYDFPMNFNHPYIASSIRDFWSRWHISLSTWFRDYVYIPLGGSRRGKIRSGANMWGTMLISGLWHGASWAFCIWGAMHAFYLSIERLTRWPERLGKIPFGRHLAMIIVFVMVLVAWVFFRVGSMANLDSPAQLSRAGDILAIMFDFSRFNAALAIGQLDSWAFTLVGVMMIRQLWFHFHLDKTQLVQSWDESKSSFYLEPLALAGLILACVFLRGSGDAFIYFQF